MTKTIHNKERDRDEVFSFRIEPGKHRKSQVGKKGSVEVRVTHTTLHREGGLPCAYNGSVFTLGDNCVGQVGDFKVVHAKDPYSTELKEVRIEPPRKQKKARS